MRPERWRYGGYLSSIVLVVPLGRVMAMTMHTIGGSVGEGYGNEDAHNRNAKMVVNHN